MVFVRNITEKFGINAGKVWTTLNMHGPLTSSNLLKNTRLSLNDLYAAIGWLARENKIYKNGSKYELKETNLTDKIGLDAGKVWNALNSQRDIDVSTIAEIAQVNRRDAYSALGWLARENKIKTRCRKKQIKFELK